MDSMRVSVAIATVALGAMVVAGCGSDDPPATPTACLAEPGAYVEALTLAPADVRLEGGTPISGCLVDEQAPGALASVGESMLGAANQLNAQVRRDGDIDTALSLGYLVGAVDRGAAGTGGIHQDLRLRISAAARFQPKDEKPFGAAFERSYNEGYAAGREAG
jgi:hypothetical protein